MVSRITLGIMDHFAKRAAKEEKRKARQAKRRRKQARKLQKQESEEQCLQKK